MYDMTYREADAVAIDTAYNLINQGAAAPGAFYVPGDAKRITAVKICTSNDTVADAPAGWSTAVHLMGKGLAQKDKNYAFSGPCGFTGSDTAAHSAAMIVGPVVTYKTNIPVIGGNEIVALGYYWGVLGNGHRIGVWLEFDGLPGPIVDVDYRESDLTAANTPVVLVNRGGVQVGPFKTTGKRIIQVRCGGGFLPVAGPLAALTNYRLSGPALLGADYEHSGHSYSTQDDTLADSGGGIAVEPVVHWTDIPCRNGMVFQCEGTMLEDDVGTIYGTVTVCYG
jgi:hypothetical protein